MATVQFGADITELETAAKEAIALMNLQNLAIQNLMVTQVNHNKASNTYQGTVKVTLENGKQVVAVLQKETGAYEVLRAKLVEVTKARKGLTDEEKTKRSGERYAKNLQTQADAVRESNAPVEERTKSLLNVSDFARIAEATLFKSALNAVTDSLSEAITKAREYQIQISLIRTVSQDAQMSFGQWSTAIKEVSSGLGIDLVDTAKAAYDAIQSQVVTGAQTLDFLTAAGNLARTTGSTIKQSGDLLASVIQGFEQSITQADHTAAVLFKTVELGRIQMGELTNTMGRVAPSANVLGISLEEVSAAMSTLTRQGIKTSDATTLITNVILKLAKPTEGMTKLLKSWGFESAEAAIKTLGFADVLRKLAAETDGGRLSELAEFFNELRGLRGAVGLTSAFKDFEKDLKEIQNSEETFHRAQEIRAESASDKLTKFATNVKNVFTEEYAQIALSWGANIIKPFGQGTEAARIFANGLLALVGGLGAARVATYLYSTVNGVMLTQITAGAAAQLGAAAADAARTKVLAETGNALLANAAAENARTVAINGYIATSAQQRTAMVDSIGTMALVGAGIAAATAIWSAYTDKLAAASYATQANIDRIQEAVKNISSEKVTNTASKNLKTFTDFADQVFRVPLKGAAEAYKKADMELTQLQEKGKKLGEEFGFSYKAYLETFKDTIKELNKEITKSEENIKRSKKEAQGFKDTLDSIVRDTQMKYATEQQKILLTETNIMRLKREADDQFAKGDDDSIASARKKYDTIAGMIRDNFDREQDLRKEAMEKALKDNPNLGNQVLIVSTEPLQKRLNNLLIERNSHESSYVKMQKEGIDLKKEEVKETEETMRRLDVASKKLMEFSPINKEGKVKDEFMSHGKFDEKKVRDTVDKLKESVKDAIPDPLVAMDFMWKMYERTDNIITQAHAKANEQLAAQDQVRLGKAKDASIKSFKDAQDEIGKASSSTFTKGGALDMLGADAGSLADFAKAGPDMAAKWLKLDNIKRSAVSDKVAGSVQEEHQNFLQMQQAIKANARNVQGQLIPRVSDIEAADKAFEKLKERVMGYISVLSKDVNMNDPSSIGGVLLPTQDGRGTLKFGDVINDYKGQKQALLDAAKKASEQEASIQTIYDELRKYHKDSVLPLAIEFPELAMTGVKAAEELKTGMEKFTDSINAARESTQRLKKELETLPPGAPGLGGMENSPNAADAEYFSTGGFVGFPGKAKGTDKVPAWLTPGEMVINAASTRKFYSQLVDMNRGKQPRYYSAGGVVTNTVGDIHVTVNGTDLKAPAKTGRAIAYEIRREIRRGTIR